MKESYHIVIPSLSDGEPTEVVIPATPMITQVLLYELLIDQACATIHEGNFRDVLFLLAECFVATTLSSNEPVLAVEEFLAVEDQPIERKYGLIPRNHGWGRKSAYVPKMSHQHPGHLSLSLVNQCV